VSELGKSAPRYWLKSLSTLGGVRWDKRSRIHM